MRPDLKAAIYGYDETLESALKQLELDKRIIPANKLNIIEQVEDGKSRGLSMNRLCITVYHLRRLATLTNPISGLLQLKTLNN